MCANAIENSPNGEFAIVVGKSGAVTVCDLRDPADRNARNLFTIGEHAGSVLATAFSSDGKTVATADSLGSVRLWDVQSGVLMIDHIPHIRFSEDFGAFDHLSLVFSPDDSVLVACGDYRSTADPDDDHGIIWAWYASPR